MGHVLNYTMGDVLTHFRRRRAGWSLRPMGWDSFGLPAENAAIREGGHPQEIVERNIEEIRAQMKRLGWVIDWDREVSAHHAGVLPVDAVAVPALLRARARLPQGGAGELVPERPDRGRQRVRDRRALRALRRAGRGPQPRAVVHQDHRLRRRAAPLRRAPTGPSARRRSSATGSAAARAPRSSSASRSSTSTSPSSRRGRTRCTARPSSCSRPSIRSSRRSARRGQGVRPAHRAPRAAEERAAEEEKTGVFTGLLRDQPGQRREAADLGRRLRADGLRHRRDHGRPRARRARPPVRRDLRHPRRHVINEDGGSSTRRSSTACRSRRRRRRSSRSCAARGRAPPRSATASATGACPVSATGAARFRSSTARPAVWSPSPTTSCRCSCPRSRTTGRKACPRSPATRSG